MITQEGFAEAGPDAADADAGGTIWESGQAPPLTPRDGICSKGKPLAPTISYSSIEYQTFLTSKDDRLNCRSEGVPLAVYFVPGRDGRGLARFQNCSCGVVRTAISVIMS